MRSRHFVLKRSCLVSQRSHSAANERAIAVRHSAVAVSKVAPQFAAAIVSIASRAALRARASPPPPPMAFLVGARYSIAIVAFRIVTRDRLLCLSTRVFAVSHARCCSSAAVMKARSCNASHNSRLHPPSHSAQVTNCKRVFKYVQTPARYKYKYKHSITKIERNEESAN